MPFSCLLTPLTRRHATEHLLDSPAPAPLIDLIRPAQCRRRPTESHRAPYPGRAFLPSRYSHLITVATRGLHDRPRTTTTATYQSGNTSRPDVDTYSRSRSRSRSPDRHGSPALRRALRAPGPPLVLPQPPGQRRPSRVRRRRADSDVCLADVRAASPWPADQDREAHGRG